MQPQIERSLAMVVREGLKGHHVLFAAQDLSEAFSTTADAGGGPLPVEPGVAGELGSAGLLLARSQSIDEARRLIGDLTPPCRAALARLYLRFLARCAAARGDAN